MFSISFDALTKNEEIGKGGFGIVYKGTYRFGPAAIKQLQIDNLSPEAEEEFNKEANIMAQLHHPHIVHFYGYCSVPKCLVMEYMPKGSLFKVLHSKEPLDWNIRMRIATEIVSGLAFLHSSNILHRDIKSFNVLLDAQMGAKLTDFGLSKVKNETKSQTTTNKTSKDSVGTVQWMAPELFKRRAIYTPKSDIYSLGITLWELASRKIPYAEDSQGAIPAFVQQGEREDIPSDCPPKLGHLIQQCWSGNPEERPTAEKIAIFMSSDAKTLDEQTVINTNTAHVSMGYQLTSDANYQVTSQIASDFVPVQENINASLANLKSQSIQATTQVVSPIVAPIPKPNLLEQKNTSELAMLRQFQAFTKSSSQAQVSASDLKAFLRLVAEGEQDQAEAMLKSNPVLALVPGDVTDLSKRTFTAITAFQYAVWALDWRMWMMLRKYLSDSEAKQQAESFEMGAWVKNHGVSARWILDKLLQAYEATLKLCVKASHALFYKDKKRDEANTAWVKGIGGMQLILPAHVINEYCCSWPALLDPSALLRTRQVGGPFVNNTGDWFESFPFESFLKGGSLGNKFAICGVYTHVLGFVVGYGSESDRWPDKVAVDRDRLRALIDTRTTQHQELLTELKPKTVQKKSA